MSKAPDFLFDLLGPSFTHLFLGHVPSIFFSCHGVSVSLYQSVPSSSGIGFIIRCLVAP